MPAAGEGIVCFLGIGSNQGDLSENCREALVRLGEATDVTLARYSSLYRTEPIGAVAQPWFLNGVAEIQTPLPPLELLRKLEGIESRMGRRNKGDGGPRIIDLDILFYGQEVIQDKELVIPHGQIHRRRFVLVPLHEIAPWAMHPLFGVSVKGLLDRLDDNSVVEIVTDGAWLEREQTTGTQGSSGSTARI